MVGNLKLSATSHLLTQLEKGISEIELDGGLNLYTLRREGIIKLSLETHPAFKTKKKDLY